MQQHLTTWLHDGSIGDVWASLPSLKEYYRKYNKKAIYYLTNGQKAFYYENAVHPTLNESGEMVMLNENVINMMIPLLKAQEYIYDARVHNEELIHADLNVIRNTFVNMPYGDLRRWYHYVIPDLACDLSKPYITVPDTDKNFAKEKIIVTRSERYLNTGISFRFLKKYEKDILFCGTELEYLIFKTRYGLDIERLIINDFLELAQAIKQCKFHITNQTQAAQLSEGLKTPRILELCKFAPNVQFIGENAFEYYAQISLEYYVDYLLGTQKTQTNGFPMPPVINLP